jgi:hypothetical protein
MKCLLTLLLLVTSSTALAVPDAYRVEVIVFRHLQATPEPREATELRSFSRFPDLEESKQAETLPEAADDSPAAPSRGDVLSNELVADELYRSDLPDDLHVITEKSEKMDATWRRLRSSKGYRPLVYAAWEQNRVDYYPPIRIHDQNVIDTRVQTPGNILFADLTALDPLADYRSNLYQIDGSLQLRRSRFLHLYLDLELREEVSQLISAGNDQAVTDESFLATTDKQFLTDTDIDETGGYGVYAIQQNRQISTGEMQYFDTPYFGALVYVTNVRGN